MPLDYISVFEYHTLDRHRQVRHFVCVSHFIIVCTMNFDGDDQDANCKKDVDDDFYGDAQFPKTLNFELCVHAVHLL